MRLLKAVDSSGIMFELKMISSSHSVCCACRKNRIREKRKMYKYETTKKEERDTRTESYGSSIVYKQS